MVWQMLCVVVARDVSASVGAIGDGGRCAVQHSRVQSVAQIVGINPGFIATKFAAQIACTMRANIH